MLKKLSDEKLISIDGKIKFDYQKYWDAIEKICIDIREKFDLSKEDIGIVAMARGALPMLVSISHELGIRKVSTIQLQMSNSDKLHDYGNVRVISECINDDFDKFIIFEDIIYKGKTTDKAIDILKNKGKKVLAVYSLIIDEGFENIEIRNKETNIKYVYEINPDDWVYFFWETDLRKIGE